MSFTTTRQGIPTIFLSRFLLEHFTFIQVPRRTFRSPLRTLQERRELCDFSISIFSQSSVLRNETPPNVILIHVNYTSE